MAIEAIKENHAVFPESHDYYCVMTDTFKFKETKKSEAEYKINVSWSDTLTIEASSVKNKESKSEIRIEIEPNKEPWSIGISKVVLVAYTNEPKSFTILWKAFDHELIVNNIKADIVQLNGYYQYVPKLKCECTLPDSMKYSCVLRKVVFGEYVTEMVSADKLAASWAIPEDELIEAAEYLRGLGYEIRNHATNPQIEEGNWLIPYAFPTLTPQSVQLRKKVK